MVAGWNRRTRTLSASGRGQRARSCNANIAGEAALRSAKNLTSGCGPDLDAATINSGFTCRSVRQPGGPLPGCARKAVWVDGERQGLRYLLQPR